MTSWSPDLDEAGPVYLAITRALESDIANERLSGGERLPTHRELAERLGVNVGTVSRAYAEARRRGLIEGTVGRGTFVRRREASGLSSFEPAGDGGLIDLSVNVPVAMPCPDLSEALGALTANADLERIMAYQEPVGSRDARSAGAAWLTRSGIECDSDRVVVCAGAQHAILVALGAIAGPGDLILCEALTYPGFLGAARLLGLRVRGVAIDDEGLIPESLEEICRTDRPRLLYCMPTLQNPTCSQIPATRRRAIARIAQQYDLMIVQDEIQLGMIDDPGPSLAALAPDHVFTIASLSKLASPGIRIAYLVGPASHGARLAELIWSSVWMTSPLCAELASRWLVDGTVERLISLRRQAMKPRHRLVSRTFGELAYRTRAGAYQVWLTLPERWTSEAFAAALLREGIRVSRAGEFRANGQPAPNAIRISLSATPRLEALERALETIRRLHDGSPPRSTLL
jgi:DNA-binding transcriptional MocR family regulator